MTVTVTLLVVGVVFLGALTRATFGFGEAVIAMPLLTLAPIALDTAVSLIGLAGLTIATFAVAAGWRHVDRAALARLAATTVAGVPVGLALIKFAPAAAVTAVLGAFLVAYGAYALVGPTFPRLAGQGWALPFGFAAGVLGSAYNFNGTPVAVYGSMAGWSPHRFRGTLQAHFLISGIFVVAGQALGGLWTPRLFVLYGLSAPALAAATVLGGVLHRRIPAERFQRYVYALIVALGLTLLVLPRL